MESPKLKYFLSLIVLILLNSCQKKEVINVVNPPSALVRFIQENMPKSQFFTIDASTISYINGLQNTNIEFPSGCLKTPDGQPVLNGKIEIELKELYTKKDMLLSSILPTANNFMLVSGGEIYVRAMLNGVELTKVDTSEIKVTIPVLDNLLADTTQMSVFYTEESTLFSSKRANQWGDPKGTVTRVDSGSNHRYIFYIERLHWINCDYFYNEGGVKTIVSAVTQDPSFNIKNTMIILSIDGINSMIPMFEDANHVFSIAQEIPVGRAVTFVAIANKNGQLYAAYSETQIGKNHKQSMNLMPLTPDQLKAQLDKLK